jgi:hypothetical protein
MFPNLLIALGALIVALGAYLSQLGWNKASEIRQRIEMVRNLAETNRANFQTLQEADVDAAMSEQRAAPVEIELFTTALASGVLAGSSYESLRLQLRATKAALQIYNYAASFTTQSGYFMRGPRDLAGNVTDGLEETRHLADILQERPYSQLGLATETDGD